MADKNWKRAERKVSKFFGTHRTPLSGSSSRHTCSDTLHPRLYIEAKRAKRYHAVIGLWDDIAELAKAEGKVPVIALVEPNRPGFWVVVKAEDLGRI